MDLRSLIRETCEAVAQAYLVFSLQDPDTVSSL